MTLKEEYLARKALKQERELHEAKELVEATVLIAEKLDTATLGRIVDAMTAVEQTLGPFNLPSLKKGLDAAEAELQTLASGKAGLDPKKTGAMLGKAMAFYKGLSEFLREDLPVLLKSRMMAPAKANPDQPVGPKLVPVFTQALAINKPGGFLQKLFGSNNIPYVNNDQLALELAGLTYTQLSQLAQAGKVPAVMSGQNVDQAAQAALGQTPAGTPGTPQGSSPPLQAVMDKLGGPQGLITFLQKNQLDKADSATVSKALGAVLSK